MSRVWRLELCCSGMWYVDAASPGTAQQGPAPKGDPTSPVPGPSYWLLNWPAVTQVGCSLLFRHFVGGQGWYFPQNLLWSIPTVGSVRTYWSQSHCPKQRCWCWELPLQALLPSALAPAQSPMPTQALLWQLWAMIKQRTAVLCLSIPLLSPLLHL